MKNTSKNVRRGFTLIELSLAIVFISFILLTISYITIHIIGMYQKGLAMKDISSTGRELIDEFSRSISLSSSHTITGYCDNASYNTTTKNACRKDHAHKFIYQQRTGRVYVNGVDTEVPIHGAFCTGSYTYVWNTGYALNSEEYHPVSGGNLAASLTVGGTSYGNNFRLLKVIDPDRYICKNAMATGDSYNIDNGVSSYSLSSTAKVEELLDYAENNLVFYDMTIFRPTQHTVTLQAFYSGTFILGTVRGNINITGDGDYCGDPPEDVGGFAYCALNKFNFAMRATGQQK